MIAQITGKLFKKLDSGVVLEVQGLYYEIIVARSVLERIDEYLDAEGKLTLVTYHYIHNDPSRAIPVLVGFLNEVEKDFFEQFITVSGIGPKAALRALNQPICQIARAIDEGDLAFLKTLPGIGTQRAKEVVAKLQGRMGKFALIQDKFSVEKKAAVASDFEDEVLSVLLQLQYKKPEAEAMIQKALARSSQITSAEELLNEIYKQRVMANG